MENREKSGNPSAALVAIAVKAAADDPFATGRIMLRSDGRRPIALAGTIGSQAVSVRVEDLRGRQSHLLGPWLGRGCAWLEAGGGSPKRTFLHA
jgi:hypothetical protein